MADTPVRFQPRDVFPRKTLALMRAACEERAERWCLESPDMTLGGNLSRFSHLFARPFHLSRGEFLPKRRCSFPPACTCSSALSQRPRSPRFPPVLLVGR
ncbi:hypothetical protein MRX96_058263 [Rhipicephalus microplus]